MVRSRAEALFYFLIPSIILYSLYYVSLFYHSITQLCIFLSLLNIISDKNHSFLNYHFSSYWLSILVHTGYCSSLDSFPFPSLSFHLRYIRPVVQSFVEVDTVEVGIAAVVGIVTLRPNSINWSCWNYSELEEYTQASSAVPNFERIVAESGIEEWTGKLS